MKKLMFLLVMGLLATSARALVITPQDARGNSLFTTDFVGAIPCNIDNSTGTNFIVCNSTVNSTAFAGGGIVYGIITSSIAQSDYLILKDTGGAGSTGFLAAQTGAGSLQSCSSTIAVIGNQWQVATTSGSQPWPYPVVNLIKFPVPLQFANGILAGVSASPTSNNGVSRWTILWRPLLTTSLKTNQ